MMTLGMTYSVCRVCRRLVPAKVVAEDGKVYFEKFCATHGQDRSLVYGDAEQYLRAQRFVKPGWVPLESFGESSRPCPEGCGLCSRHEQHLCMPIVEITSRCNLACPVCLVSAGQPWDMTRAQFRGLLDGIIRAEKQVDVLNLSGGEPLLHPELLPLVDDALARPEVVRVSISTNGLRFLSDRALLESLRDRHVVICLQFDGFKESTYELLRGRRLLDEKLRILALLDEAGVSASLTMTAAGGVNDDQFRPMLDYLFAHENLVSMMVQPVAFAGRGAALAGRMGRLTVPDVVRALGEAQHPAVSASDFLPLPCSHPLCFSLAFYIVLGEGRAVSITRLTDVEEVLDAVSNRLFFGLDRSDQARLCEMVYRLWSGPAALAPDSAEVLAVIRAMLRDVSATDFDPRKLFCTAERRVKSIFIHAFQDADTFDLARVRRCCNAYPQPDGRLVPACVHNVLRRRP